MVKNPLRGALIIGAFSSALAAPTSTAASYYAQDLVSNQLEPVNAPVPGPHLATRPPGLDFVSGVQETQLDSIHNNDHGEVDGSDKLPIFPSSDVLRPVSEAHVQLGSLGTSRMQSSNVMLRTADQWVECAKESQREIEKLQSQLKRLWNTLNAIPPVLGNKTKREVLLKKYYQMSCSACKSS
ncbi:hypothetical protein F5878DRAFT_62167 [Lentinula raphanica]|uniref:Uncharacterized protein n=1 Tax=Lentinula raphanica TaxID=153919 RepID=A0AA38UK28_9AGAR|nr:hypothetical protein F5878DRAFT_62167 [Lentinula raphanica]